MMGKARTDPLWEKYWPRERSSRCNWKKDRYNRGNKRFTAVPRQSGAGAPAASAEAARPGTGGGSMPVNLLP